MRLTTYSSSRIGLLCGLLLFIASLGLFTNYLPNSHAAGPLTAGEPLNQIKKLIANDGASYDGFFATAISNETIVVGAYGNNNAAGAAYIFERNQGGADSWGLVKKLAASDATMGDFFGAALAISGDTIVVGAYQNNSHRGAAYVFERNQGGAGNWGQVKKFTASDVADPDFFASAVAINGDTILIGAYHKQFFTGAAYIFGRNQGGASNWGQVKKLTASDAANGDNFGSSVAISGDTVAIGALGKNSNTGAAYVFGRNQGGANAWGQMKKMALGDGAPQDAFGSSIGISADTIVVGAFGRNSTAGAAYIFERNQGGAGNWGQVQTLTANNGAVADRFGVSVGISGDAVVVGADQSNESSGAAYLFGRNQGGIGNWGQMQKLTANDGAAFDYFGETVGIGGDAINGYRVIVGALYANNQAGAAYLFSNLCSTPSLTPASLPIAQVGTPYNQTVTALPNGSYAYSVTSGLLPNGLTLNSTTGVISGIPSQLGVFNFRITAISQAGCAGFLDYAINVATCVPITVNPTVLANGTIGEAYSQTITAVPSLPYTFSITSGALPIGLSLNPATGVISGTPTIANAYSFRVTATSGGCSGYRDYTVSINGNGVNAPNLQFYPLAHPVRLLDTRAGQTGCDAPGAKIPGGTSRTQTAAGRMCDGLTIPADAAALVGNVTTVQSGGGFLTLYASDIAKPNSANSNYSTNQVLNTLFTVRVGATDGAFKIFVSTDTDLVVDITGYYAAPSARGLYFHPLSKPVRLLDTRAGAIACFAPGAALQSGSTTSQIATTTCDGVLIPAGAMALTGNATTVNTQTNGFMTLYPADAAQPLAASSNFQTGVNLNAPILVGLSPSGQFNVYVASTTDVVVDVTGYYSAQMNDGNGQGLLFNALSGPVRLLDTRAGQPGCFMPGAQMAGGTSYQQPATGACTGVPVAAKAVVGNATTLNAAANGYLTFWPSDANQPFIATSNYRTGITFNRHFTVGLGTDGAFRRFASSTTDLVIDLSGYFAP